MSRYRPPESSPRPTVLLLAASGAYVLLGPAGVGAPGASDVGNSGGQDAARLAGGRTHLVVIDAARHATCVRRVGESRSRGALGSEVMTGQPTITRRPNGGLASMYVSETAQVTRARHCELRLPRPRVDAQPVPCQTGERARTPAALPLPPRTRGRATT